MAPAPPDGCRGVNSPPSNELDALAPAPPGARITRARPWGLAGSLVGATLVHAAVLGTLGSATPRTAESPQARPTRLEVRLIAPPPPGRDPAGDEPLATTAPVAAAGVPDGPRSEPGSPESSRGWPDRAVDAMPAMARMCGRTTIWNMAHGPCLSCVMARMLWP